MIAPEEVTAILVTRGDVDMSPVVGSLPFEHIIVVDNSQEPADLQCYGRFIPIERGEVETLHVYVQDDDLIIDALALLAHYDGEGIVANKHPEEEWRFIGGGAFFPKTLPDFSRYVDNYGSDSDFYRVADVVFAYTHPYRSVWVGYEELLSHHDAPNRMYLQPNHYEVRERARARSLNG